MSDHAPTILLFLVTWVEKMTCWAGFKSGHCSGKGSDQYFYLYFQGWKFCIFAQQVIFPTHVTKNNRIVGEWSLIQVPANRHMTDSTGNVRQYYFYGFFRGFQRFFRNSWEPVYWTVEGLEEKCEKISEKEIRRSLMLLYEEEMVSFKLAW